MRGRTVVLAAVCMGLIAAGCGEPAGPRGSDTLFLRSGQSIAVIKAGASAPSFRGSSTVPSPNWTTVVRNDLRRRKTRLTAVNPLSGSTRWKQDIAGNFRTKVVSHDGTLVAMGPLGERSYKQGRGTTTMLIAGSRSSEPQVYELLGNYEPEAFSVDGRSLFLVSYLPARNPDSYQVRKLDLRTGEVEGVYTPDQDLQERMGGTARIQAASPDGTRLYTLYTVEEASGTYAFIHVLALDELWAHCIDLPAEFATFPERATAITVSPDGRHIHVVNSAAEKIATIDAGSLQVTATADVDMISGTDTYASTDGSGRVFVASSGRAVALDGELREIRRWQFDEEIRGLQVARDGRRLYVGLRESFAVIDPGLRRIVRLVDPPGIRVIGELGPVIKPLKYARQVLRKFTCAC